MTRNRKAELQRKLGMSPLPTPPPHLAQRIKDEIPREQFANASKERDPLRRYAAVDVRIAASILLLISAAFAALEIFSRSRVSQIPSSPARTAASRVAEARPAPSSENAPPSAGTGSDPRILPAALPPTPKLTRRVKEEEGAPAVIGKIKAMAPANVHTADRIGTERSESNQRPTAAVALAQKAAGVSSETRDSALDAVAKTRSPRDASAIQMADASRERGEATPSAVMAPAAASAARVAASNAGKPETRQGVQPASEAGSLARAVRSLRRGEKPDASTAAALVQHFSLPAERPERGLRLDAEAIAMPVAEPDTVFLRVSIDAPAGAGPKFATGLRLSIEPANNFVSQSSSIANLTTLLDAEFVRDASMTSVTRLQLRPGFVAANLLASVQLRYRDAAGREQHLVQRISRTDVVELKNASLRGRSAALTTALLARLQEEKPVAPLGTIAREAGLQELADLIDSASPR